MVTTETTAGGPMARRLAARAVRLAEALEETGLSPVAPAGTATVPAHVRQAAKDALARGETHYTSRPGIPELRGAVARQLTAEGFPASPDSVVIANGGAEGLYIVLQALVSPGTRLVTPDAVQPPVAAMVAFIGGELVRVPGAAADRFMPGADAILGQVGEGDVILLASPSPVTGVALSPEATRALAAGAAERGATLVLDRSLAPAAYDPATVDFGAPDQGANVVVVGSFSAGYGLDGWRVGYFSAPAAMFKPMQGLKQAMSICTTAVSQFAALAALDDVDGWHGVRRRAAADVVASAAGRLAGAGLPVVRPDAGTTLLVDVSAIDADDRAVVARLGDAHGAAQPGSAYGAALTGWVRLSAGDERADEAVAALVTMAGGSKG